MHSHFGIYNFSGSCADSNTLDASSVAGGFADQFGSPTASMCQIELASTKNWKVGDLIYFWSKQMASPGQLGNEYYSNTNSVYNTPYVTGVNGDESTSTTPEAQILGGKWPVHTITKIQGNIVTLDRPVCHTHIDAGTLAYKYNRGNLNIKSPNPKFSQSKCTALPNSRNPKMAKSHNPKNTEPLNPKTRKSFWRGVSIVNPGDASLKSLQILRRQSHF